MKDTVKLLRKLAGRRKRITFCMPSAGVVYGDDAHSSATLIQAQVRGRSQRRADAATKIQRNFRGMHGRREAEAAKHGTFTVTFERGALGMTFSPGPFGEMVVGSISK